MKSSYPATRSSGREAIHPAQGLVPRQPVVRGRPVPDAHARRVERHPELLVAPAQGLGRGLPLVGHRRREHQPGDRDDPRDSRPTANSVPPPVAALNGPPPCGGAPDGDHGHGEGHQRCAAAAEPQRGPDDEGEQEVEVVELPQQCRHRKQVAEPELGGEHGAEAEQHDLERPARAAW